MDSPDYPAAHSMDSCWFGVDKDGRVGSFETGDSGAMPIRGVTEHAAELTRGTDRANRPGTADAVRPPRPHFPGLEAKPDLGCAGMNRGRPRPRSASVSAGRRLVPPSAH